MTTTSIFNLPSQTSPDSKIHISNDTIPQTYLDSSQPPVKWSPFRQVHSHPLLRSVQICMPESLCKSLPFHSHPVQYSKAILSLHDILDNEALRKGNYVLLSSPLDSPSSTRMFVRCGTLTLVMSQQVYQRSGLTFPTTKLQSGGRKHEKGSALQRIEVDMRLPGLARGRKGFDRLMYAAKNVDGLKEPRVWLCVDLDVQGTTLGLTGAKKRKREEGDFETSGSTGLPSTAGTIKKTTPSLNTTPSLLVSNIASDTQHNHILAKHHPTHATDSGTESIFRDVLIPPIFNTLSTFNKQSPSSSKSPTTILEDDVHEIIEYFSLLFLEPAQLTKQQYGKTDSFISQYRLPDPHYPSPVSVQPQSETTPRDECNDLELPLGTTVQDLRIVTYEGLISSDWMIQILIDLIRRSRVKTQQEKTKEDDSRRDWVVIKAETHDVQPVGGKDGYMIVLHMGGVRDVEEKEKAEGKDAVMSGSQEDDQRETTTAEERQNTEDQVGGFRNVICFEFVDTFSW